MNAFCAELIGTMLLVLLGNSVVANAILSKTKANNGKSTWLFITMGWSLAVFVGVMIAAPYSGAHLNPAVSIGLAIVNKFPWAQVPIFILAQFLGGAIGAFVVWIFYKDHFSQTKESDTILSCFSTSPAIENNFSNLISEAIATFVLLLGVLYIKGAEIKTENAGIPIGLGSLEGLAIALLILSIGISLGGTTGYALNPARDLAPRIMHHLLPIANKGKSQWKYAWIPILGPIIGAVLAALFYLFLES